MNCTDIHEQNRKQGEKKAGWLLCRFDEEPDRKAASKEFERLVGDCESDTCTVVGVSVVVGNRGDAMAWLDEILKFEPLVTEAKVIFLPSMDMFAEHFKGQETAYQKIKTAGFDVMTLDDTHKMFEDEEMRPMTDTLLM